MDVYLSVGCTLTYCFTTATSDLHHCLAERSPTCEEWQPGLLALFISRKIELIILCFNPYAEWARAPPSTLYLGHRKLEAQKSWWIARWRGGKSLLISRELRTGITGVPGQSHEQEHILLGTALDKEIALQQQPGASPVPNTLLGICFLMLLLVFWLMAALCLATHSPAERGRVENTFTPS